MDIDPKQWPALSRLLDEWLDVPEAERAQWLKRVGPEYGAVLADFRKLVLSGEAAPRGFMDGPALGSQGRHIEHSVSFEAGQLIGPYRLQRELGRGGMGVVWLAARVDGAWERDVALKLPFAAMDRGSLRERFAREKKIMERLEHPHIGRLYDAGSDRDQPYLAMEYVEGAPITSYCDAARLGIEQRLRLFLDVLRAVQYAHANLIVHRDLKPSNILVNARGEVRLLDFGISKLLSADESADLNLTDTGGRVLTPRYASPEQVLGSSVTTASDIYSLGVLLHELVTGVSPYLLQDTSRGELERAIVGADPIPASASPFGVEQARVRGLTVSRLRLKLKADLETIVQAALRKQPEARYATAEAFAADIQRYLDGLPIHARRQSRAYRLRRFLARNRIAVAAAFAVLERSAPGWPWRCIKLAPRGYSRLRPRVSKSSCSISSMRIQATRPIR